MHKCASNSEGNSDVLWQHWYPQNCRCGWDHELRYDAIAHMEELSTLVPQWIEQGRLPFDSAGTGWGRDGKRHFFDTKLPGGDDHNTNSQGAVAGFFR